MYLAINEISDNITAINKPLKNQLVLDTHTTDIHSIGEHPMHCEH